MKINTTLIHEMLNINTTYDFSNKIKDRNDILEISPCQIEGSLTFVDLSNLSCNLKVNCNLVLASARSLKPIDYPLSFNLDLLFGNSEDADFILEDEIPLSEIIFGHILLEKPVSVYLEEETEEVIKEKRKVNPAFKELADWHK